MKSPCVKDWLQRACERLSRAGVEQSWLDAEILLGLVLGDRQVAVKRPELELDVEKVDRLDEMLARRVAHEPLAYITGEKEFWSLTFKVSPAVLIPRPETETLLEAVLTLPGLSGRITFADIGCGCGCIAAGLAHEWPAAQGWAVDNSPAACHVARENLRRLGFAERVTTLEGDLLEPVPCAGLDLVAANLPYIASAALDGLPAEVLREPRSALDGGPDGLELIRRLAPQAGERLRPGGWLALEISPAQADALAALCQATGLVDFALRPDLSGRPRVALARRPLISAHRTQSASS